jgi:serine/threonine protein kinase
MDGAGGSSTPVMNAPMIPGFEDFAPLGSGNFATVYSARESVLGREVAIKIFSAPAVSADAKRRFERECKAIGGLGENPNIVTLYGTGTTADGRLYVVMELMTGGSLSDRLRRVGAMPAREVVSVGIGLAAAVQAAHQAGVLHRDIDPSNVLISRYGGTQLADFGITPSPTTAESGDSHITETIGYVAPEVIDGRPASPSSDVYSLAATLITMITGKPPFAPKRVETLSALVARLHREAPPAVVKLGASPELEAVLHRALDKLPEARYESASVFAAALSTVPEAYSPAGAPARSHLSPVAEPVQPTAGPATPVAPAAEPEPDLGPDEADFTKAPIEAAASVDADAPIVSSSPPSVVPRPSAPSEPTSAPFFASMPASGLDGVASARTRAFDVPDAATTPPIPPIDYSRGFGYEDQRRRRLVISAGVLAALVLVGGGIVAFAAHGHKTPTTPTTNPKGTASGPGTTGTVVPAAEAATPKCSGFTCTFAVKSAVAGETYEWTFAGSKASASGSTVAHTFSKAGKYAVSVVASDGVTNSKPTATSVTLASLTTSSSLHAGARGSHHLTLKVSSKNASCLASTVQLQRNSSGWKTVETITMPKSGSRVFSPSTFGTYRAVIERASVAGGVCGQEVSGTATTRAKPSTTTTTHNTGGNQSAPPPTGGSKPTPKKSAKPPTSGGPTL